MILALTACGGSRKEPREDSDLEGVRGFLQQAFASSKQGTVEGGGLCGDPRLIGESIGSVPGNGACGVENAVRLRAVGDVSLSQPATINCRTAKALATWVETGAKPAVGKRGGGLDRLEVAAHYVCRTRNHQPGAKISEHGKGNAIDIRSVHLKDGTEMSVLRDWGSGKAGKALKAMHKSACGPFGTVLGPNSDRFHKDHFHFDTAQYRSGSYCR